jgi:hypothetical protein
MVNKIIPSGINNLTQLNLLCKYTASRKQKKEIGVTMLNTLVGKAFQKSSEKLTVENRASDSDFSHAFKREAGALFGGMKEALNSITEFTAEGINGFVSTIGNIIPASKPTLNLANMDAGKLEAFTNHLAKMASNNQAAQEVLSLLEDVANSEEGGNIDISHANIKKLQGLILSDDDILAAGLQLQLLEEKDRARGLISFIDFSKKAPVSGKVMQHVTASTMLSIEEKNRVAAAVEVASSGSLKTSESYIAKAYFKALAQVVGVERANEIAESFVGEYPNDYGGIGEYGFSIDENGEPQKYYWTSSPAAAPAGTTVSPS